MELKRDYFVWGIVVSIVVLLGILLYQSESIEGYEKTTFFYSVDVIVNNVGTYPAVSVPLRLALPTNQSSYQIISNITYSHEPEKITYDVIGNQFAHYTIDYIDSFSSANYSFNISLTIISTDFNIQKNSISEYDENLDKFLLESPLINYKATDVLNIAKLISLNSSNIVDIAWNSYSWIIDNINYQQVPGENDALTTLKNKEGGSAEFGNLYVALLRANGIPARRISGWGKNFQLGESYHLAKFAHGWTEFYLPDYGWIPVDPTWGQRNKFDYFAKSYPSHLVMTRGSDIHFLKRGLFTKPYGETSIETDYIVTLHNIEKKNLSIRRGIVFSLLFVSPIIFILFLWSQKMRQRKIYFK